MPGASETVCPVCSMKNYWEGEIFERSDSKRKAAGRG